jgi:acetyl esterase/lipase
MLKPKMYSYEEYPVDNRTTEGMKEIVGNPDLLNVQWRHNIEYLDRGGVKLHLQILEPLRIIDEYMPLERFNKKRKWPTIVYIPGSGWLKQEVKNSVHNLSKMVERGFLVAIVEYRPSDSNVVQVDTSETREHLQFRKLCTEEEYKPTDRAPFPAQVKDAKEAIRFLKRNAEKYNIDSDKIVIWGDSSGGHTATLVAMTGERCLTEISDDGFNCSVKGCIDYYAPSDMTKGNLDPCLLDFNSADGLAGFLIGGKNVLENSDLIEPTIITNYIEKEVVIPPILIFHGDKDRIIPFSQSLHLFNKLREEAKDVNLYKVKNADHGGASFWTDKVLDIVQEFIKRTT